MMATQSMQERDRLIVKTYHHGELLSLNAIGAKFGITGRRVRQILNQHKEELRPQTVLLERDAAIMELYISKDAPTIAAIGGTFCITGRSVRRILNHCEQVTGQRLRRQVKKVTLPTEPSGEESSDYRT